MTEFLSGLADIWWIFPASLIISTIATTLAMEGVVLFTPSFLILFPRLSDKFPIMEPNEAIGVALSIAVFGFGSASFGYLRQGVVDKRLVLKLLSISIPFAIVARLVAFQIPQGILFVLFGLVLFVLTFVVLRSYLLQRKLAQSGNAPIGHGSEESRSGIEHEIVARDGRSYRYSYDLRLLDAASISTAGALVGLIGVGVGAICNTLLIVRHHLPMRVATGTAVVAAMVTVLFGSITHITLVALQGDGGIAFEWQIVALAIPAVLTGGQIAPHISARFAESTLKKCLMTLFVFTGAIMLAQGIFRLAGITI